MSDDTERAREMNVALGRISAEYEISDDEQAFNKALEDAYAAGSVSVLNQRDEARAQALEEAARIAERHWTGIHVAEQIRALIPTQPERTKG